MDQVRTAGTGPGRAATPSPWRRWWSTRSACGAHARHLDEPEPDW